MVVCAWCVVPDDDMGSHADRDSTAGPASSGDTGTALHSCQYPVSNIALNLL
jgi:hypothetical protein